MALAGDRVASPKIKIKIMKNLKPFLASLLIIAVGVVTIFVYEPVHKVAGSVSQTGQGCTTSASVVETLANGSLLTVGAPSLSTSTVRYMSAGTGTTTLVCDLYNNNQAPTLADIANLKIQFAGSSTLATLNAETQYSADGIDWYSANRQNGTTTQQITLNPPFSFVLPFASSTPDGSAVNAANSATSSRITWLDTPTRYVRIIFSITTAASNVSRGGAFWAEIVSQKQRP